MKLSRKDIEYAIYNLDTELKIKDIDHILRLREEAIIKLLQEGNSIKDGKLVTFSFEDKPSRLHHNGFSKDGNDTIKLPARRVYHVDYLPKIKEDLNHPLNEQAN